MVRLFAKKKSIVLNEINSKCSINITKNNFTFLFITLFYFSNDEFDWKN